MKILKLILITIIILTFISLTSSISFARDIVPEQNNSNFVSQQPTISPTPTTTPTATIQPTKAIKQISKNITKLETIKPTQAKTQTQTPKLKQLPTQAQQLNPTQQAQQAALPQTGENKNLIFIPSGIFLIGLFLIMKK